ncbi:PTS fructose transporter subunit IIB [Jeotgalibaca caeni]|uniref:PTS fructose transporter subunit IIB n=1 Tax=Jeotgalibaca caeni TaxID=3028623 RepID=UPI00237E5E66|nr:PTS fructose transporter subunit IIB [Jeotgalibaca caeni]MDE1549308.1 fructose PTS transporter subunit IIB [Jeotgalibaca caeni]
MKKVVGVCACPAGIAHTYLAAENLENIAKKKGYKIKVETNGSSGVENALSKNDIEEADAVIIAADTKVEMERFRGKKLVEVSVTDAIRKADEIFKKIEEDKITTY